MREGGKKMEDHMNYNRSEQAAGREKRTGDMYSGRIYRYSEMDAGVRNVKNRVEIRARIFDKPVRLL